MSSAAAAGNRAFGVDRGLPFPLEDLDGASTILLLGTNVAETMPPFIGHLAGAQAAGGLIVVDPRRTATARLTDDGKGLHVQPAPGTDLALLLGLIHIVIAERLVDADYVAERTIGFDRAAPQRRAVVARARAVGHRRAGLDAAAARAAARVGRRHVHPHRPRRRAARRRHRHRDGGDQPRPRCSGLPGRAGIRLRHPHRPGQRPGRPRARPEVRPAARATARSPTPTRARTSPRVWGVDPDVIPGPGVPAVELLQSLGQPGRRARPARARLQPRRVVAERRRRCAPGIGRLDLLVVCDFFLSETAALADVVLPVTAVGRGGGHHDQPRGPRHPPPPRASRRPTGCATSCGSSPSSPAASTAPATLRHRPRAGVRGAATRVGGRHRRLLRHRLRDARPRRGRVLAVPARQRRHAPPLRRPLRPPRRARPARRGVGARAGDARVPADGELTLITGRLLEHYQSGAQTRRVPELAAAQPEARASMHPATAERLGIADGDAARARQRARHGALPGHGSPPTSAPTTCSCRSTSATRRRANLLTSDAVDPISAMPEFKTNVVRVTRASRKPESPHDRTSAIVLVGYGPVGARFVEDLLPAVQSRRRRAHGRRRRGRRGVQPRARRRVRGRQHRPRRDARRRRGRRGGGRARASSLGVAATSIDRAARIVHLSTGEDARLRPARARHRLPRERAHARRRGAAPPRPGLAREVRAAARGPRRRPARGHHGAARPRRRRAGARRRARPPPHHRARRGRARPRARPRRRARRRRRSASCTTGRTRCRATSTAAAGRCCVPRCGARASRSSRTAVPRRWRSAPTTTGAAGSTCSSRPTASSCAATCSCSRAASSPRNELADARRPAHARSASS